LAADGLEMEDSTLYPLLRRLESQGLLESEWREEEKRKKRFYRLSPGGAAMLAALTDEWRGINASLDKIL
jgi:DNA-binding PadR family transcriptional regulator